MDGKVSERPSDGSNTALTSLEFAILGPLEVRKEGHLIPVSGSRETVVLAALLLQAGRPVSLGWIVEAVWGSHPPRASCKSIRNSVSAIRRRFTRSGVHATPIQTQPDGYLLALDGCHLDTDEFRAKVDDARQLAATGQTDRAVGAFRAALGIWRGPALAGVNSHMIEAGAVRLNEQRLAATEEWLELELALGRHRQAVCELWSLAMDYPLREKFAAQLMLALYRSARQAEALEVFHALAGRLRDDLGINPGREICFLHEAILRQDRSLDLYSGTCHMADDSTDGDLGACLLAQYPRSLSLAASSAGERRPSGPNSKRIRADQRRIAGKVKRDLARRTLA